MFDHLPHVTDATSHWFQARVFAQGRLAAAAPPCPQAFFQHNVVVGLQNLWHTKYYPGQALWLVWPLRLIAMPLAFALFLLASHRIARHYVGPAVAILFQILLATSPLLLLLAASFMSHLTVLMWMALAWAFFLRAVSSGHRGSAFALAAGFCGGMAVLVRPQDAALLALIAFAALLPRLAQRKMLAPWAILGALPPLLFLFFWNFCLYGNWLGSGYLFSAAAPVSQTPIIRDTLGFTADFTPARALRQFAWTALKLNQVLLGWPAAWPWLLAGLALPGVRRGNALLLLCAAMAYAPYYFFHYYGFELEARYAATAAPFLVLAVARTLVGLWSFRPGFHLLRTAAGAAVLASVLYSGAHYWPRYLWPRYSNHYEETSSAIHRMALAAQLEEPALVLLPNDGFIYSSGFVHNDPFLRSPIVYARDVPAQTACLARAFPHRQTYRYVPSEANRFEGRFELVATSE